MGKKLVETPEVQKLLDAISGRSVPGGNPRTKNIVRRIVSDLFTTIEEFDIKPEEFWAALGFLQNGAGEYGLIAPGFGFDRFLDIKADAADEAAGITGGTPRTIEGPLYVPGAPLSRGFARMDDGADKGTVLIMHGTVRDVSGKPIRGAVVDVWHANTMGNYSYFDASQSAYNNRRRIETDEDGRYKFRSVVPSGYSVPPQGAADRLLKSVGRHGNRPAHVHFFVSAPSCRHLTTQINIEGDPYLRDDFAQATRDGLIPDVVHHTSAEDIHGEGLNSPYDEIAFDFTLLPAEDPAEAELSARPRVSAV